MSENLYLLWFVPKGDEFEDNALLIGIYEDESAARAAIERVKSKPGFVDFPEGFKIHTRELGKDSWTEGFTRD